MLDDLLDMFDRDRREESAHPTRRRGLRAILDRFVGDQDGDDRARRNHRYDHAHDTGRGPRDRDGFDLDD